MRRRSPSFWSVGLAALLAGSVAHADALVSVTQTPAGGAKGQVIDRPSTEPYACGIIWEQAEQPFWATGMDITQDYPGPPDLVLAFSVPTHADNLRIESDNGRVMLGPHIGHPDKPFQLDIESDYRSSGLIIGTSGYEVSAALFNQSAPAIQRTSLNMGGLWGLGTDLRGNGGGDFWLIDCQTGAPVLTCSPTGGMGFFGNSPAPRPTVAGSWSDGSAAKSLLAALVKLGLVTDQTGP